MSQDDHYKQFFPDQELDNDRLVVEVPADPMPLYQPKIPSGLDPMERIYMDGMMYRGLAGGRVPWWVLISGWVIFGGFALPFLITAIASASLAALPTLLVGIILLIILWRGTTAKLSIRKRRRRKR